ncbi:uncharacterized protein DUF3301 [Sinobacterium caligoides]|uniref:Uncharacterized protein DUF3301 n=1 Tax=Sinobacterium caligoides TaxID=933926 RepID=A0A3N2E037_9GAMM|nr:DUF3301 domain-containing protein [Sinobacterium caligoides]ROS04935.1 uncharacterized protein DUF3301 [Sinobacterium caligoides]
MFHIELMDLFLLLLAAFGYWYWASARKMREWVFGESKRYCEAEGVQLLDDCVALHRLWFKRDSQGNIRVWRAYQFEFSSTGDERYLGRVITLGKEIELFELQPYRIH